MTITENNGPEWDLPIETAKTGMQRNIPWRDYALAGKSFRLAMDNGDSFSLADRPMRAIGFPLSNLTPDICQ